MHDRFDPNDAATILASAWHDGTVLDNLPVSVRPTTMTQGYDVQDRLIAHIGRPLTGWKLGLGSTVQKRTLGIGRSVAGRILASHVHEDGATIFLPNAEPVTIEFEIAYRLGRDIAPDAPVCPIGDAIQETRVTFELIRSRFVDRRAVGWPSFAADNAGFQALVLGATVDPDSLPDLVTSLVVTQDGREAARALTGEEATDPMAAFADLVATARERGMVLPKGSIISTGTVSKPFDIASPEARVEAHFLGRRLTFRSVAPMPRPVPQGTLPHAT